MSFEKIKSAIEAGKFEPVYFFCGEEAFFIDTLTDLLEARVLDEAQRDFNQHVLYGRDTTPQDVLNMARKYPVFADRQLVVVREAQHMKQWDEFVPYLKQPVPTTILVFAHKHKAIDGRTAAGKAFKKYSVFLKAGKLSDYKLPDWIKAYLKAKGKTIDPKSAALIVEHLGNDLAKIANELDKLLLNVSDAKKITPNHIELYIGISKDFNAFELSSAVAERDFAKAMGIVQYFEKNPRSGPIVFIHTILFNYFSKIFQLHHNKGLADSDAAKLIRVPPFYFGEYKSGLRNYDVARTESAIRFLAEYDAKSKGVGSTGSVGVYQNLRELMYRIMQ